jgi:hypothetical protein
MWYALNDLGYRVEHRTYDSLDHPSGGGYSSLVTTVSRTAFGKPGIRSRSLGGGCGRFGVADSQ